MNKFLLRLLRFFKTLVRIFVMHGQQTYTKNAFINNSWNEKMLSMVAL